METRSRHTLDSRHSLWPHDRHWHDTSIRTDTHITLYKGHTSHVPQYKQRKDSASGSRGSQVHLGVPVPSPPAHTFSWRL